MPGEGFIMDALRSLKNNRRDRTSKTSHLGQTSAMETPFIDKNKATAEDLVRIREKIQLQELNEKKQFIKTMIIVFVLVVILFMALNYYWQDLMNFFSFQ